MGLPLVLTGDSDLSPNNGLEGNGDLGDPGLAVLFLDGEKLISSVELVCLALWRGEVRSLWRAPLSEEAWRSRWFL